MGAPVRLLSGVRPHVTLEQPRPGEGFVADLALVAKAVGQNVHLQGGGGHVLLVADVAALGVVGCQLLVSLTVPGKVGTRGKVLATLFTLVLGF